MYQITCDDYVLYDPRDDDLIVLQPKCKLEVNTVGEASFTILSEHPYYDKLKKLKSVFEIRQDSDVIFRGRMTGDSKDFYNQTMVDLEGIIACANDTIIPPFNFPQDFPDALTSPNIVEYFLNWVITQHNLHVESWQQIKLGTVGISQVDNYISRESKNYTSTWEILKSRLVESELGGYLVIRYEDDGNYIDYVSDFALTNTQRITIGENLLDINTQTDASQTYSAILPIGAEVENADGSKSRLTLESIPDGAITDDLVKIGNYIYSKSAKINYGWVCVPIADATWDDVTLAENLKNKAVDFLTGKATHLSNTITVKAVDLSFTDDEIQAFRIYRNIIVDSPAHGLVDAVYPLSKLDIDILNPQNTDITVGDTVRTLIDTTSSSQSSTIDRIDKVADVTNNINQTVTDTVRQQMEVNETAILATASEMILSALEQYVETDNYNEFKSTVEATLSIMADEINMKFTSTSESINNVDGDLQMKFNQLYKYIGFSENGITLGSGDNAMSLNIDNDMIVFTKNGKQFGWWDGVDFHTGNIVVDVNEKAQFGNFAFIPRSDGSLMFLKVGG